MMTGQKTWPQCIRRAGFAAAHPTPEHVVCARPAWVPPVLSAPLWGSRPGVHRRDEAAEALRGQAVCPEFVPSVAGHGAGCWPLAAVSGAPSSAVLLLQKVSFCRCQRAEAVSVLCP